MKQIITLCLAVFFMVGIQNVQAQSKEETIQWLNDYGKKIQLISNERDTFNFSGYDGESLHFSFTMIGKHLDGTIEEKNDFLDKINPKDILYQEINSINEDIFKYSDSFECWEFYIKAKPKSAIQFYETKRYWDGGVQENNGEVKISSISIYVQTKEQQKDAIRLIKAIMHLAKLSGADELPKVTEDTF